MTKAQKSTYERYCRSTDSSLYDCYESFSAAKARAWKDCKELRDKKSGWGLKVISHNGWMFTAGFVYEQDGKEMFMYITPSKDETFEITEEE